MTAPARPSRVVPVSLRALAAHLGTSVAGVGDGSVTGVSLASTSVRAGDLYAALPGARTHGARFAAAAARAGAVAILTDPTGAASAVETGLPLLVVESPRAVLGGLAAFVYGDPALGLTLVGVTGTQGKTTTTQLLASGAASAGRRTAVIGTMGTWVDGVPVGTTLTTPEAPDLHALFAVMRDRGVDLCAMEVSSHALVMGRVDGVVFDLAVFTNFGRDHLDFHADVDDYFAAKAALFTPQRARRALVNVDDDHLAGLVGRPSIPTRTFSVSATGGDWSARTTHSDNSGSTFEVRTPDGERFSAAVSLVGGFNVSNALCAIAAVAEVGGDARAAAEGVAAIDAVSGRMERIERGQRFSVVVDYAHKPDALKAALEALRPVTAGRILIVIGAGGDRDQGKRPLMGEIAAQLCDVVVVTDDNPRSEPPEEIRSEVIAGARQASHDADIVEIGDRARAIDLALRQARPGDTVVIAGKGHEKGQEVGGQVHPFDDREAAGAVLDELMAATAGR